MSYAITKAHVWVGVISDQPGALAEKLRSLRDSGVNLEMIITRREKSGRALLFISPLHSQEEIEAANRAGLSISESLRNMRIEGPNAPGLGARITTALEDAGINIRGYSAAALGELHVTNIAFDSDADEERAREVLLRELSP